MEPLVRRHREVRQRAPAQRAFLRASASAAASAAVWHLFVPVLPYLFVRAVVPRLCLFPRQRRGDVEMGRLLLRCRCLLVVVVMVCRPQARVRAAVFSRPAVRADGLVVTTATAPTGVVDGPLAQLLLLRAEHTRDIPAPGPPSSVDASTDSLAPRHDHHVRDADVQQRQVVTPRVRVQASEQR